MPVTIYHNPRCSKSRATLELIRSRGIEPQIVEYLKTPPTPATLRRLAADLGLAPRALLRTGEPAYAELGLADPGLDDDRLLAAMSSHPQLIERPIVVSGARAVIGRPPEHVLAIL